MSKSHRRTLCGLACFFVALWGGFYFAHVVIETWAMWPTILTAVIVFITGIVFLLSALPDEGGKK